MTPEINEDLTLIEFVVLNTLHPSYIEVSYQMDYVYILVSKPEFRYWPLNERISSIFKLLEFEIPDMMKKYSFVVEAMDDKELDSLFKLYGQQ